MVYAQTLIDDFSDASIDTARWTVTQGPGVTESGGTLNLACVGSYPRIEGDNFYDLSKGIFAGKLSTSGVRATACEFYIGAHDASGNHISALGGPNGTYLTFQAGGLANFSGEVITDTTVGVGPSWVNGTWWGIGNIGSDNVIRMYKSTDGQNWTEMARCTVGGTFNKTAVGILFMAGVWNGTSPTLVANFDDASYWAEETEVFVTRKTRWNNQWVPATPKVRIAGEWVTASPKPRVGGVWDPLI